MSARAGIIAAAALAIVIAPAGGVAQVVSSPLCKWTSKEPWVRRQAEFFAESKRDWTNDSLRIALLAATGLAVPLRAPVNVGVQIEGRPLGTFGPTADTVTKLLKQLAAVRGSVWPTRSVVGAAGTHAVYLLAQRDTALGRVALHRLMEAGPAESPAVDVAVLEDRLRVLSGRKQLYGTQFRVDDAGRVVLAPMEDSAHADLRREDAGLPPFRLGMCLARNAR